MLMEIFKNFTLYVPGGPLSKVGTGFVQNKVVRVPNSGGAPLKV